MTTSQDSSSEIVIEVSNVWKIFGGNASEALAAIREKGLSKAEVLAQFNAVVGVADVSLNVNRGEIFCVMGLSGSGKSTLVRHFNRLLEPTAGKIVIDGTDVMAPVARQPPEIPQPKHWDGVSKFRADAAPVSAGQCRDAIGNPADK